MKYKLALFDADGVVVRAPEHFSRLYAKQYGIDAGRLETFFDADFLETSMGRSDLKELIMRKNDLWHWDKDPQELLDMWFAAENHPDQELIDLIKQKRADGLIVYLVTIQEKYRAQYMRETMFRDMFDRIIPSCDVGYLKRDPEYFEYVLEKAKQDIPDIDPTQIVYFDDSQDGLETAETLGIQPYLYEGIEQVTAVLSS